MVAHSTRSGRLRHAALLMAGVLTGALAGTAAVAQAPITLSIIDVGGDLSSMQAIVENYRKANPNKVKDIRIQRAPQPELPAKIKAQQDAGRLDINLIMTGQAAASALIANDQLVRLLPGSREAVPARRLHRCRQGASEGRRGLRHPVGREQRRPGVHLQSEEGAEPAEERAGAAGLGQGQSGQVLLCAAIEQRPGHVGHRRPALHPRRQGSRRTRRTAGTRPGRS